MANARTPARARACDSCKSSKIKCDTSVGSSRSCSNCLRRATSCTFEVPLRKRGPQTRARASRDSGSRQVQSRDHGIFDVINDSLDAATESSPGNRDQPPLPQVISPALDSPASTRDRAASWNAAHHHLRPGPSTYTATVESASSIWLSLQEALLECSGGRPVEAMAHECMDLYLRHLFPTTPLIHDEAIRYTITLAFGDDQQNLFSGPFQSPLVSHTPALSLGVPSPANLVAGHPSPDTNRGQDLNRWRFLRAVSLVCAVCAFVVLVIPEHMVSHGQNLAAAHIFLKTSRDLLSLCHDQDIQHPEASSIIIRYFNSLCIHASGNARVSWYTLGEAVRLAQEMRLYDESSLAGLEPAEAQLRRAVYWQLYTGDRSAAILNNRPFSFHPLLLDTPMTLRPLDDSHLYLLNMSLPHNTADHVRVLNQGFNLSSRLFEAASTVILDLRTLKDFSKRTSSGSPDLVRGQKAAIVDSFINFRCVLDDMPDCIHRPWQMESEHDPIVQYHQGCYWVQHVNLKVTFHCLRMIILQNASEYGFTSLLGHSDDVRLLAMEQADIARDVLDCIQNAPFLALKLNGESCVEKVRQVGAVLLRISQDPGSQPVARRANADFQILLNLLAQLDSKASDSLSQQASAEWY